MPENANVTEAAVLGYANVYKEEDGTLELGATDIDKLSDVTPWAREYVEHVGIAEIRLLPESSGISGTEYIVRTHGSTFSAPVYADDELRAASREAGWALINVVDEIRAEKRDQVRGIFVRLGVALQTQPAIHTQSLTDLINERNTLMEAVAKLAAFDDEAANKELAALGSYSGFDEPVAVKTAREALEKIGAAA